MRKFSAVVGWIYLVAGIHETFYVSAFPVIATTALGAFAFPLAMAPGQATDAFKQAKNMQYQTAAQQQQVIDTGFAQGQQNLARMGYGRSLLEASASSPLSTMLQAESSGMSPDQVWQATANSYVQSNQILDGTRAQLEQLYPQQQQSGTPGGGGIPGGGMPGGGMPGGGMPGGGMVFSQAETAMPGGGMPGGGMPGGGMPGSMLSSTASPFNKPVSIMG